MNGDWFRVLHDWASDFVGKGIGAFNPTLDMALVVDGSNSSVKFSGLQVEIPDLLHPAGVILIGRLQRIRPTMHQTHLSAALPTASFIQTHFH